MSTVKKGNIGKTMGVSVIVCTNRPHFLQHMFQNYFRQRWKPKELIIIVNKDKVDLTPYNKMAAQYKSIRVFHLPARYTLGYCLNYASARAKHPYIAKMDDDEYYAPDYLVGMMLAFEKSKADVVGKRSYFIHLSGKHMLIQRFSTQNRGVSYLAGGTLVYKRHVWRKVKFANRSLGEDVQFCRACRQNGFKLYAADRYNFCALRRRQYNTHTWKVSDQEFLSHPQTKVIARTDNYKKYVIRPYEKSFRV
jgi:glycosyltransferase involved in cell wall biosynthesis